MAGRMIPDVSLRLDGLLNHSPSRSGQVRLGATVLATLLSVAIVTGHESERTRVVLSLQHDGRFTLEVANDPAWLLLRLETFAGGNVPPNITPAQRDARLAQLTGVFADRIVLFVDAHEVREIGRAHV